MIELTDVTLSRGSFRLRPTSLLIPAGQCGTIVGNAGAGKTSLVEAICGLQAISSGQIKLRGQIVAGSQSSGVSDSPGVPLKTSAAGSFCSIVPSSIVSSGARNIGYLPQDVVLFPDLTVAGNIAFGPQVHRWPQEKVADTVESLAALLELSDLLTRKPHQLSGGQQKRVALARAVALGWDIVCLDEPFVSLDEESRMMVRNLLRRLLEEQTVTVLVVTHQPRFLDEISSVQFDVSK